MKKVKNKVITGIRPCRRRESFLKVQSYLKVDFVIQKLFLASFFPFSPSLFLQIMILPKEIKKVP